jgi:hypothetical protein
VCLQFVGWLTYQICGFVIYGLIKRNLDLNLQTRIPQNFADLRLQIEPKKLQICDLQTLKNLL